MQRTIQILTLRFMRGAPFILLGAWLMAGYQWGWMASLERVWSNASLLFQNRALKEEVDSLEQQNRRLHVYLDKLELERRVLSVGIYDLSDQPCAPPRPLAPCQPRQRFALHPPAAFILGPFAAWRLMSLCLPTWTPLDFRREPARLSQGGFSPAWR